MTNKLIFLKLYYPNKLNEMQVLSRSKLNNPKHESHFNWFLCSRKIWDNNLKKYFIEIISSATFYSVDTGESYGVSSKSIKLLVKSSSIQTTNFNKYLLEEGYDGMAFYNSKKPLAGPICQEVTFVIKRNRLVKLGSACEIILYAKRNNTKLQSLVRKVDIHFPTCKEIDNLVDNKGCSGVSKIIYKLLYTLLKGNEK